MVAPELIRYSSRGVTLLGDSHCPGGVTLAFTERTGGVSSGCYGSLNLGDNCGDDLSSVERNRKIVLEALGASDLFDRLVCPNQVHEDRVIVVGGKGLALADAQREAKEGADAIVCLKKGVPVLLCYADCVPVILVSEGAFAVVHSGWRGTMARIAAKALQAMVDACGCLPAEVNAYVGPHIGASDYEVSDELASRFADEFGGDVVRDRRHLDLYEAIRVSLADVGVDGARIVGVGESTASHTDRFFSYRAEGGKCGRHGAIAFMSSGARRG